MTKKKKDKPENEIQKVINNKKELVRMDLNLEKWPLFSTEEHKGVRVLKRVDSAGNKQVVTISPYLKGDKQYTLTAHREGKIIYALLKKWQDSGKPSDKPVHFSLRQIADILNISWGRSTYNFIKTGLLNLRGVCLTFESSYRPSKEAETLKLTEPMNILMQLRIIEKQNGKDATSRVMFSEFAFHKYITGSILNKFMKPVRLDVLKQLKGDTVIILYRWLDLVMSDKTMLEYTIDENLAKDLGLEDMRIDSFLRSIKTAAKNLEGKELSTGKITYCKIEELDSGKGKKLVVRKGKQDIVSEQITTIAVKEDNEIKEQYLMNYYNSLEPEEQKEIAIIKTKFVKDKYSGYDVRPALLDAIAEYQASKITTTENNT
ncbi:MAG: hypothetical protein PHE88_12035 [Elusimicrobia bacterium]|nr:hypothetical protein [Elusimicrobiota bacterium]